MLCSQTRLSAFTFTFHFHALEKKKATDSSVFAWKNPGDEGAWWAAVYGVTQSWTQLKQLSSSSSHYFYLVIIEWDNSPFNSWKVKKTKMKTSDSITENRRGKSGSRDKFYFLGSQNHYKWCLQP